MTLDDAVKDKVLREWLGLPDENTYNNHPVYRKWHMQDDMDRFDLSVNMLPTLRKQAYSNAHGEIAKLLRAAAAQADPAYKEQATDALYTDLIDRGTFSGVNAWKQPKRKDVTFDDLIEHLIMSTSEGDNNDWHDLGFKYNPSTLQSTYRIAARRLPKESKLHDINLDADIRTVPEHLKNVHTWLDRLRRLPENVDSTMSDLYTPKFYKGLRASGNPYTALREMYEFKSDYGSSKYLVAGDHIDSLNELRALREKIQNIQELEAEAQELADALSESDPNIVAYPRIVSGELGKDSILKGTVKVGLRIGNVNEKGRTEPYTLDEAKEKYKGTQFDPNRPYEYGPDIGPTVGDGWRLLTDYNDQLCVGRNLDHCYGNIDRYGTGHARGYRGAIRSKNKLLITKGGVTAEIDLEYSDPENPKSITHADVGQIQTRGNAKDLNRVYRHNRNNLTDEELQLVKEVYGIAKNLTYKEHSDKRLKNIKRKVSDERLKVLDDSSEEERLLSIANSMKTRIPAGAIRQYLLNNCPITDEDKRNNIVSKVMYRLLHTETNESSGAMGKAHNPSNETRRIAETIAQMRGF